MFSYLMFSYLTFLKCDLFIAGTESVVPPGGGGDVVVRAPPGWAESAPAGHARGRPSAAAGPVEAAWPACRQYVSAHCCVRS